MAVSQLKVSGCAVGSLLHYPLSSLTHWRKMHEICPLCFYQVRCLSWLPLVKHADTGMFALFRMINESNKLQISSFLPSALFKRKFPTRGPGSREAGSCVEQQPFPFLCLTAQPSAHTEKPAGLGRRGALASPHFSSGSSFILWPLQGNAGSFLSFRILHTQCYPTIL